MSVEIVVPLEEFRQVRDRFPDLLDDYARAVGNRLRKELPRLIHEMLTMFQTGRLARSVRAYVGLHGVRVTIGEGVADARGTNYTRFVFEGVEPHEMDQLKKGRTWPMVWSHAKGSGVAMRVMHPGQQARTDIIQAIKQRIKEIAVEEATVFALMGAS